MATFTRDELILKLGIGQLDYQDQQKVLENIANAVSTRIWRKITETLDSKDLDTIEDLMKDEKNDEIEKLIKSKFPDYDKFAIDTENEVIDELTKGLKVSEDAFNKLK